jgi:hypothetical protein
MRRSELRPSNDQVSKLAACGDRHTTFLIQ